MMFTNPLIWLLVPALVSAKVHNVDVGKNGLQFTPGVLHAAVGDEVHFHFYPGGHSVAESTFGSPCHPKSSDSRWSGFFNPTSGVAGQMWVTKIQNHDPIWLYCARDGHCNLGMAMGINPGKGQHLSTYQSKAKHVTVKVPKKLHGGHREKNHGS